MRLQLLKSQVATQMVLEVIVRVLDLLRVYCYLLVLLHIINLQFALDLELNSFDDWVRLRLRLLQRLFPLFDRDQVRVKLLELVLNLVLDVVEVEWALGAWILRNLQSYLLRREFNVDLDQDNTVRISLMVAVWLNTHEQLVDRGKQGAHEYLGLTWAWRQLLG